MKCQFCGSTKTVMKNVQSEADPAQFSTRPMLLHNTQCVAHLTEKELLLLILEKLDERNRDNPG